MHGQLLRTRRVEVGYVAGHMQGTPESMQQNPVYGDVVDDVLGSVVRAAADALNAGAREVWIDPGIGFGKTIEHNLEILAHVDRLVATGIPVLLGVSRKSVIGYLHGASDTRRTPGSATPTGTDDRLEGSLAIPCGRRRWALMLCGCTMFLKPSKRCR